MDKESEQAIYDEIKKLPTLSLQKKLLKLDTLNKEKVKIEDDYEVEFNILKSGYDVKFNECYAEISAIVRGDVTVPQISTEEKTKYNITDETYKEVGIPDYWSTVLLNSDFSEINEKDTEILKFLKDCRMKPVEGSRLDYTLEFEFAPNEYFSNTLLTKRFFYDEKTEEVIKSEGCQIDWTSPDKNPGVKVVTKKVKKGKKTETKTTEKQVASFFDLFSDKPISEYLLAGQANFFKEEFFPNSFEFYLNILPDEDDFDGEDFDDEEDEDDEDDDDDDAKDKKKSKKPKAGAQDQKCKNQ